MWHVDGVSCVGKTSFVQRHQGLLLDFSERVRDAPFFRYKAESHTTQIIYTATFVARVQAAMPKSPTTLYVDRSPLSDLWYELVFKHPDDVAERRRVCRWLRMTNAFDQAATVFVVPHVLHAPFILAKMHERQNGLDTLSLEYVTRQIRTIDDVSAQFHEHPNVRIIRISPSRQLFTVDYYAWLDRQIIELTTAN